MARLSAEDVQKISRFCRGSSSRQGALSDATHTAGKELLKAVRQPALLIHSREDRAVPFSHAEWALENIPHVELCEAGFTGHFFWIGPDFPRLGRRMAEFLS